MRFIPSAVLGVSLLLLSGAPAFAGPPADVQMLPPTLDDNTTSCYNATGGYQALLVWDGVNPINCKTDMRLYKALKEVDLFVAGVAPAPDKHLLLGANNWIYNPGDTGASIIVDDNNIKALMLVGNNVTGNAGFGRQVDVYDYLNVHGPVTINYTNIIVPVEGSGCSIHGTLATDSTGALYDCVGPAGNTVWQMVTSHRSCTRQELTAAMLAQTSCQSPCTAYTPASLPGGTTLQDGYFANYPATVSYVGSYVVQCQSQNQPPASKVYLLGVPCTCPGPGNGGESVGGGPV